MKYINNKILLLILTIICNLQESHSRSKIDTTTNIIEQNKIIEDVKFVKNLIEKEHPNIFKFISKRKLNEKFLNLQKSINKPMTKSDFRNKLLNVLQLIGDGHLSLTNTPSDLKIVDIDNSILHQIDYWLTENRLFIKNGIPENKIPAGAEIVKINGKEVPIILEEMLKTICSDGYNTSLKFFILNSGLFAEKYEQLYGIQEYVDITILFENKISTHHISSKFHNSIASNPSQIKANNFRIIENSYGILQISTFDPQLSIDYSSFFNQLNSMNIKNLILDLRGNTGGDYKNIVELFGYLIDEPRYFNEVPKKILADKNKTPDDILKYGINTPVLPKNENFKGKIYVLLNGGSFSATSILLANLQSFRKNIVLIGEESGGGRNGCTGGVFNSFLLPNSKLVLTFGSVPIKVPIQSSVKGRGVFPDIQIKYSITDVISKRDLELEYIFKELNIIKSKK